MFKPGDKVRVADTVVYDGMAGLEAEVVENPLGKRTTSFIYARVPGFPPADEPYKSVPADVWPFVEGELTHR